MEWYAVNLVVPLLAPALFAFCIWVIELAGSGTGKAQSQILAAYIDGQAGFVALAWCAATLYDMDRFETCSKHAIDWHGLTVWLGALMFFSGLMAAVGARWSLAWREAAFEAEVAAAKAANLTAPTPPGWLVKYLAGWTSGVFVVLSLLPMVIIHLIVTAPGGPTCS